MRAARPATRATFAVSDVITNSLDVLFSGFRFLDRDRPTDPLVASQWRQVIPSFNHLL